MIRKKNENPLSSVRLMSTSSYLNPKSPPPQPTHPHSQTMATLSHPFTPLRRLHHLSPRLRLPSLSSSFHRHRRGRFPVTTIVAESIYVPIMTPEVKERLRMKKLFEEAYDRCRRNPMDGVPFTVEEMAKAFEAEEGLDEAEDEDPQRLGPIGTRVQGTVLEIDRYGAIIELDEKNTAYLPHEEASICQLASVEEAGFVPGLTEEFVIIDENVEEDTFIVSAREIQYGLAWERCRQLQAEDVTVKGLIVGVNRGGVGAMVEGLVGFIPFSQISTPEEAEQLLYEEIPLKIVEVEEEEYRLILSRRKAVADSQAQLGIGTVVVGTVTSLKPYGAFIDVGGINGLLHVSQISHDRVSDISTVLQPGDTLKVMILSHDRERGRVSLSTKKLEPTPGDMIRNPKLVFEKAEEMAQTFRQRIAQAEAMARADMLRFQPESGLTLSSDGILGSFGADLPAEGIDFSQIPPVDEL